MSISVADNFSYQGTKPLDARFQFSSVANMKAAAEATLYNGCLAYVTATKTYYTYDSSNSVDSTTGRWREYKSGTEDYTDLENKPKIGGVTLSGNKSLSDLGITKSGVGLGNVVNTGDSATPTSGGIEKFTTGGAYTELAKKQDKLTAGNNITIDSDNIIIATIPTLGVIHRSDLYEIGEKIIGKWTDGRPIYQSMIYESVAKGSSVTVYATSVSSAIYHIIDCQHLAWYQYTGSDSSVRAGLAPIPLKTGSGDIFANVTQYGAFDTISTDSSKLRWTYTNSHNGNTVDFFTIIRYTKITDSANSYNYADENDYSESEKIVGKWINGKTVYQKTFNADVPNVSSDGESNTVYYSVGSNVDMFVSLSGVFTTNAGNTFPFERMAQLPSGLPGYGVTIGGITNNGTANKNTVFILNTKQTYSGTSAYVTAQYTKV